MKALSHEHISFVHSSQIKGWKGDPKAILVITSRINGRHYKKRFEVVGKVTPYADRKKGERWRFCPACMDLEADTVLIIAKFLDDMNARKIKFDPEKGDLELL